MRMPFEKLMEHVAAVAPAERDGVDQALTFLRENPDGEVAVGQLWWARQ